MGRFGALSKIKDRALWKKNYSLLTIFAKHSIVNLLEGSEYVLDFKYVRVLNFQGYTGFTYFRKYGRVLNMHWDAIMERFCIPGF